MKRRGVLFALGGAGIIGFTGYQMSGVGATHGPKRTVSLISQDDIPDRCEMNITVEVLQDEITSSQTARLRVTTTNTGRTRAFSIGGDSCFLFNRSKGGSDEPEGLWLHEQAEAADIKKEGERWTRSRLWSDSRGFRGEVCPNTKYESGQQRSTVYELWDDYREDGYLESGTYRWEEQVEIWNDPSASSAESPDESFTWGFEISLEEQK
jgi:hypothetical protein